MSMMFRLAMIWLTSKNHPKRGLNPPPLLANIFLGLDVPQVF
jgi:hypothetical protein